MDFYPYFYANFSYLSKVSIEINTIIKQKGVIMTIEDLYFAEQLVQNGVAYGFPVCCVVEFIHRMDDEEEEREHYPHAPLYGTGYVPCPKCRQKTAEELVSKIDANRLVTDYTFRSVVHNLKTKGWDPRRCPSTEGYLRKEDIQKVISKIRFSI